MYESGEYHVEFVEAREDAPKALETTEQAFHLITLAVKYAVIAPMAPIGIGRYRWDKDKVQSQLQCFAAFVGPVHDQNAGLLLRSQARNTSRLWGASPACLGESAKVDGAPSIRGNRMVLVVQLPWSVRWLAAPFL